MSEPANRQQFKDYIRKALGYPVQEIHVDDEQMDDRIDEAFLYYRDYHFDGTERVFLKHQVTQADKDNQFIPVPDIVIGIIRCLPFSGSGSSSNMLFNVRYHITANELMNLSSTSLIPYHIAMTRLQDLFFMFDQTPGYQFQKHKDRIVLNDWEIVSVGDYLVFEAERYLDPADYANVWSDIWLKRYATALVKKQWGNNLKVYSGVQLPGGVALNGQAIYDEAVAEVEAMEEKMIKKYSRPLTDRIG